MILLLIWKTRSRMWVVAAAFAGSFALSLITVRHDAAAAFYSPLDRFWELMAGAALAFAARSPGVGGWWDRQTRARDLCSLAGVVLIVTALWRIDKAAVFPGWKVLAPVAGTACIIAAGPRAWMNTTMFSRRPLVWMGLISYPLYLWHWPLLSLWRIVDGDPSVAVRTGIAAASIMLAAATYLLIERPLRFRSPTPRTIGMLCAMMALAAGAGAATFAGGGMPGRLPPVVQQIAGFRYDATAGFRGHRCLLYPELGEHVFAPECSDPDVAKEGLPEIVLWGDSHAAQLYPGILDRYGSNYRISQLTVAGCPPLFGVSGAWPGCPELTAASFAELAARRPALVVVAAAWINYDWRALTGSVQRLQAAGVRKVVVVGGVPVWDGPLPEFLARTILRDRPAFRVPERWAPQLLPRMVNLDRAMAQMVRASAADYESTLDSLCNRSGCLTRANGELTAFDAAHLTPAGARYVVARFRSIP